MAYFDKRWVGVFNYKFRRRFRHNLELLDCAVRRILELKPDVAVCTGDLTSTGQPGEFAEVLEIMRPLTESNIPLIYTPGNHDCYVKKASCVAAMRRALAELTHSDYTLEDMPLVRSYGDCDFVVFNTSRPSNLLCSWGFVAAADARQIEQICAAPKSRPRILVNHYPIIEPHKILRLRHRLFGEQPLVELLNARRIDLVLAGHVHRPECEVDASGRGSNIAGSVTRNGTMSLIEYDRERDIFTFESIDLHAPERKSEG